jgi:IS66 C-terminal element
VHWAHASAGLYSLIETAKAAAIEPYRYLRHLFTALPLATTVEHFEALLPWNVTVSTLSISAFLEWSLPSRGRDRMTATGL